MLPSGSVDPVPLNWITCPTRPEYAPPGLDVGSRPPVVVVVVVPAMVAVVLAEAVAPSSSVMLRNTR